MWHLIAKVFMKKSLQDHFKKQLSLYCPLVARKKYLTLRESDTPNKKEKIFYKGKI